MNKPTDLLGDPIAVAIETDHAEQCDAFDAAAAAHALLADRERWNAYVKLARNLGFRGDAEAVVFVAAAAPIPRKGRDAADPIRASIFAAAEAEGRGPHSRKHGARVVAPSPDDPTDGLVYDVAAGLDHHQAGFKVRPAKASGPEPGQGFFFGLGFRAPRDPDDDLDGPLPEGA